MLLNKFCPPEQISYKLHLQTSPQYVGIELLRLFHGNIRKGPLAIVYPQNYLNNVIFE